MGLAGMMKRDLGRKDEKELEQEIVNDPENPYGEDDDRDILEKLLKAKKSRSRASMVEVND